VAWTSRVLLGGSLLSAVLFAAGFVLDSAVASNAGVLAMLLTPVAGLITTITEVWRGQRLTAWVAMGVLTVLAVAVGVAVFAR
jgi:hypothetical protein